MNIELRLNGRAVSFETQPTETLLNVLRALQMWSVKDGCANGDCGSCAVLLDGRAVNACLVLAAKADGAVVTTVEGLATDDRLRAMQAALLDGGGVQCGFCTPGMLMTALDLLVRRPDADEQDLRHALAGNYCRCTGWVKPIESLARAAANLRDGQP